jgi:CDP-4-dehydro-6-deoxyglucose reductase/3-phenylpropionate/trans-cinnamate dioxygenase ferredoxin reductase subunit
VTHDVTITGTDIAFPCGPEETVLDAAERAGYSIPYSCRKGVCSTCEGRLTGGEVAVRGQGELSGPADGVLLCQARPCSPVEIAPKRVARRGPPARRTLTAKVHSLTWPAGDVAVLQVRFPIGSRARFRAGQYLKILMDDGDSRDYSMANPPHKNDGAQLHIRRVPGGRFSEELLAGLDKGDQLRVELPYGEFSLNEESVKPVILVATGTGFAPIKSIVEDQIRQGGDRPMHLYWGARTPAELYLADLPSSWVAKYPWFSFTPVLSRGGADWTGRAGRVQQAVLADHPDLSGHEVYACGSSTMTSAALDDFVHHGGLAPEAFYCDAFVPSGDPLPLP